MAEAEKDLDAARERVALRLREAESLEGEAVTARDELSKLDSLEEVTAKDQLLDANLRRRLRKLEQQLGEARASLSTAQEDVRLSSEALRRARVADLQERISADVTDLLQILEEAVAPRLIARLKAHTEMIAEANRLDPAESNGARRRGSPFARVDLDDLWSQLGAILKNRNRRTFERLPQAPPAVAWPPALPELRPSDGELVPLPGHAGFVVGVGRLPVEALGPREGGHAQTEE
ncbi:hypothetical protein [Anaeromyxobacter paludicola]|nr:hypothetical protein [Anaeromyxobacter paludicola]